MPIDQVVFATDPRTGEVAGGQEESTRGRSVSIVEELFSEYAPSAIDWSEGIGRGKVIWGR